MMKSSSHLSVTSRVDAHASASGAKSKTIVRRIYYGTGSIRKVLCAALSGQTTWSQVKSCHVMSIPWQSRIRRVWRPPVRESGYAPIHLQLPQESHLALAQVSRVLGEFSIQEKGNFYTRYHMCRYHVDAHSKSVE